MNASAAHLRGLLLTLSALTWALVAPSAEPAVLQDTNTELHRAIDQGDRAVWKRLLREGADLTARDGKGNTPLHLAALHDRVDGVRDLLEYGANANATNHFTVTPLILGAGNVEIVRALLKHNADPNAVSERGITPLFSAAASSQPYEVVNLLIKAGANVKSTAGNRGMNPLIPAVNRRDSRTIDLLLAQGAEVEPEGNDYSPLQVAAINGDLEVVQRLVEAGADLDHSYEALDSAGTALNSAMWAEQRDVAAYLIDQGADLHKASTVGSRTPPMVWAGYGQFGDPTLARKMIAKGMDVNTTNAAGETALFYALKAGPDTELVRYLRSVGAKEPEGERNKQVPSRPVPPDGPELRSMIRDGAQRAIDLMQHSSEVFLRGRDCTSCHHQLLPPLAYSMARHRGLQMDDLALGHQLALQLADGRVRGGSRGVVALQALGYVSDALATTSARKVRKMQSAKGTWFDYGRPPLEESSSFPENAWAVRAIKAFPVAGEEEATEQCLQRALKWLRHEKPVTLNERNFQLLGLHWGGEPSKTLQKHVRALLKEQHPDGGWAQLPTLESDAWATGQTLYTLHEAGGLATDDPAYQRGVDFLLHTQFDDGSWLVKNRTWPFQPHFDSGFPHGKDQWISIAGTTWATMALLATIKPVKSGETFPTGQELIAKWKQSQESQESRTSTGAPKAFAFQGARTVDFQRDIRPVLETSCVDCHSGEKPKGGFKVVDRASLMKGGESGLATFVAGQGDQSQLIRHVTDQVEDMEMPPLGKRKIYPALTPEQVQQLITWINEGAEWPDGLIMAER